MSWIAGLVLGLGIGLCIAGAVWTGLIVIVIAFLISAVVLATYGKEVEERHG